MEIGLFIFRRDLRLDDNTGLIAALNECDYVLPCFIYDDRQIGKNPYKSENVLQFMQESLDDLEEQLKKKKGKLYTFKGKAEEGVKEIIKKYGISAVYVNKDYTPFSLKRDKKIALTCKKLGVEFKQYDDYLLNDPEKCLKKDGKPYTVFTPYKKNAMKHKIAKPKKNNHKNYYIKNHVNEKIKYTTNKNIRVNGGRKEGKKILSGLKKFKWYSRERDYPPKSTTLLSAHNKFGTVSIREVYHSIKGELGEHNTLISQLYWRDFYTQIAYYFPHVFGKSFREKYDKIKWENDAKKFKAWCSGKTGFPIVDAGMRELNTTGFMHNRVRMIAASFLVKDLHIDWRKGEKYFAQKLVDYDPSVNNGNWQWSASTGCDPQPYFRVFNPWRQQEKFDVYCEYVKKWVPELTDVKPREIHKLNTERPDGLKYPSPIVEHKKEAKKAIENFKSIKQ